MAGDREAQEAAVRASLDALETEVDARVSSQALAPRLRELIAGLPQDSIHRPRAHRLMGTVLNRLKLDREALTELCLAKRKAEASQSADYGELAKIGRETAVVYAWRGDDRSAALELLPALAYACLGGDSNETARIIAEYGRIELEARRYGNVAMLFRLLAGNTHKLALPPREAQRMKINLCQALNRIGAHDEALKWAGELCGEIAPEARRLQFLTHLEEVRALAALKRFDDAERALKKAEALLPDGEEAFERAEFLQLETELAELKGGEQAIEHLQRLIEEYSEQRLVVREAMARRTLANTLFKLDRAAEAREALSRGLRSALDANLVELADEIRADMLKSGGADHLEELAQAIDLAGGGHGLERRFIRTGRLGKGGSGEVWRAIDLRDGCVVALKKLDLRGFGEDRRQQIVNTISTEYAAAAHLHDPCFARVLDLAMVPDGPVYIVQRYVEGPTLRELYASGTPPAQLLELLAQIAEALTSLHASQIVHRDLKPENVIVTRDETGAERIVLIDLGIALLAGQADGHARFGTAPYVSPEQLEGGKIDGRADIYALGQMIAEIWGGKVPSRFTLGMLRRADEPTLMPRAIREVVRGMLRANPEGRTSNLKEIAAALRAQRQQMTEPSSSHTP